MTSLYLYLIERSKSFLVYRTEIKKPQDITKVHSAGEVNLFKAALSRFTANTAFVIQLTFNLLRSVIAAFESTPLFSGSGALKENVLGFLE